MEAMRPVVLGGNISKINERVVLINFGLEMGTFCVTPPAKGEMSGGQGGFFLKKYKPLRLEDSAPPLGREEKSSK